MPIAPRIRDCSCLSRLPIAARTALVASVILASSCGGGGGGGSSGSNAPAPQIVAAVIGFPSGAVPSGWLATGVNTGASVAITDTATNIPVTNAKVFANGVPLLFFPVDAQYEGSLNLAPGAAISVTVSFQGATYSASGTQFSTYPQIVSPASSATWGASATNLVTWSGIVPSSSTMVALGVFDTSGQAVWPAGSGLTLVPSSTTTYSIPGGSISTGNRIVLVGIAAAQSFSGAANGSGLVIGGFDDVPITVNVAPTATLDVITVAPSGHVLEPGKTLQLTATGTYAGGATQDLTTQVTWSSSSNATATVSALGVATGVAGGNANITASLSGVSGSASVNVFQPPASPIPPLSQAVAWQIDYAHSGFATAGVPLSFPSSPAWSVTLSGTTFYPLIAGGRVFVIATNGAITGGTNLYALNESTGAILWGPVSLPSTFSWAAQAYDNGQVFVVDWDGHLQALNAATGQVAWSTTVSGFVPGAAPAAVNGIVYASGGSFSAFEETNGNLLWSADVANLPAMSTATVSPDGVFISGPCNVYKFDPVVGTLLWHYDGGCEGAGGSTPVYGDGNLYVFDGTVSVTQVEVFDPASGALKTKLSSSMTPALSSQTAFLPTSGGLAAYDVSSGGQLWTFLGDGHLEAPPIVVDSTVFVGSTGGMVYAVNAATGAQLWSASIGTSVNIAQSEPGGALGAGEGYLVVPAGNTLTAWRIVP